MPIEVRELVRAVCTSDDVGLLESLEPGGCG